MVKYLLINNEIGLADLISNGFNQFKLISHDGELKIEKIK